MYGYRCANKNCARWWACGATPGQKFEAITRWCPFCLAARLPVADLPPLVVQPDANGAHYV